jgi:Fe-S-cluster containining protein
MMETVYVHMQFLSRTGVWSINLPFVCTKCGVCCTLDDFLTAGQVKAKREEIPEIDAKLREIYDYLETLLEGGEEKYDQYVTSTRCPFQTEKLCTIYAIRPDGCRQFPNTPFGMLSEDCEALDRFKKQIATLSRGRAVKKAFYFTKDPIKPSKLTEKQYQICVAKLRQVGVTEEELKLMDTLNGQ